MFSNVFFIVTRLLHFSLCGMPSLPVCLIFKVGWPVLCLGLKVMQLYSADYNLRKRLKSFSPVCLTQLVSMTAEAVGSSCFSVQLTSSSRAWDSSLSDLLRSVFSNLCCWSSSWWGSRRCPLRATMRERGEAEAQPATPADKTQILAWTTNWNTKKPVQLWSDWLKGWTFVLETLITRTMEWASFPECRPGTGDDLCGQDTNTLHGDKGSLDSSSCWTKCLAPQTLTFPEHKKTCDAATGKHQRGPQAECALTQYLQNCVY